MKNRDLTLFCLAMLLGLSFIPLRSWAGASPGVKLRPVTQSFNPVPVNQKRYMGLTIFNFETDPRIDDERIEHSAQIGCNAVEITINWDQVYPTRQSTANWKVVDSHVQTALRLGLKVALRFHIGREIVHLGGFWGTNETMQASDGARMAGSGITQFSFAHQPTVELAKNFIRESMQRYKYLQQQNQLLFVSVVASPALELEYSPVHYSADGTKYAVPFDYSDPMKLAFRQWLQGRFSLSTLNSRWGTQYANWDAVTPPNSSASDPYKVFSANRRGQDWYVFRHRMLERVINEITGTIKSVDGAIRVVNQHGAVWDRLSTLRATYAFESLNQTADGLKFNDGPTYNHRFSMDVVRGNLRPGSFMINAVDGMFYNSVSVGIYYDQVKECFDHGASMLTLANFGSSAARPMLTQLVKRVLDAGLLNQPVTQVQTAGRMSYKLSEILKDGHAQISIRWGDQYNKNGKKPVQVDLIEDLLEEDEPTQPAKNQAPQLVASLADQNAVVGKSFSYNLGKNQFKDVDGSIVSVEVTGLPAGLKYDAGKGQIQGTPTGATTATVNVKATDNEGATVTASFRITVTAATTAPVEKPEPEQPKPEQPKPEPVPGGETVVTGNFEGYLDKVECGTIRGWVWDRNKPNTPMTVAFYADGKAIGTANADIYRDDLKSAGKGNGIHAYSFTTPASLKDNKVHEISAKVLNSNYTLKWSPTKLTCPSSARLSAEPTDRSLEVVVLGNPVEDQVEVEVRGSEGQPLRFLLTDIQGRVVTERQIEQSGSAEKQRFNVAGQTTGRLILRVANTRQAVTVHILKR